MLQNCLDAIDRPTDTYFKFRLDFDPETDWSVRVSKTFRNEEMSGTFGLENRSKRGGVTKPHLHIHFAVSLRPTKIEAWKRKIVERLKTLFPENKGKKQWYSLKIETDVSDLYRFFRYPLKQRPYADLAIPDGFELIVCPPELDDWNFDVQVEIAHSEFSTIVDKVKKQDEKDASRKTAYERVLDKFAEGTPPITIKEIFGRILDIFEDEGWAPDRLKIRSFCDGVSLKYKLMSREEYFSKCL